MQLICGGVRQGLSPGCLTPESELLITTFVQHHPARQWHIWYVSWYVCSPVHGFFLLFHSTAWIISLLIPSTFCLTLLPVRTRTGKLWTAALIEGSRQNRHLSSGLADSKAALAHEGQIPGSVAMGGKNICPLCLPSWARSVYQVGKWYAPNCRGSRLRGLTLFK